MNLLPVPDKLQRLPVQTKPRQVFSKAISVVGLAALGAGGCERTEYTGYTRALK